MTNDGEVGSRLLVPPEFADAPIVPDLYSLALSECIPGGLHMEFGVAQGRSLREIRKRLDQSVRLYGFDSFRGLPEPWTTFSVGSFATSCRVTLPNTELVEGWFDETLPVFIAEHPQHVSFMHIDCDLYSSTKSVLDAFKGRFADGSVILFDELFGYAGFEKYEYRALSEFIRDTEMRFDVLARWTTHRAVIRAKQPEQLTALAGALRSVPGQG